MYTATTANVLVNKLQSYKNRFSFHSVDPVLDYPDFLDIQLKSFQDFFQWDVSPEKKTEGGLYKVFKHNFPIEDIRGHFSLEFIDYTLAPPKYLPDECIERGVTYSVPLKAK
ncbi:MAG: hypothetical protein AAFU83_01215, partial [Bacteroidota bacterium]